jgi:hypothetical protein
MSHLARGRVAATAVAALFVAPMLTVGVAYAGPAEPVPSSSVPEGGPDLVFSGDGGLLGVGCESTPSSSAVTVPAESTLLVVNRTGYRAKLVIDGTAQHEIESGASTPVMFHRGPVSLGLKPNCVLPKESAAQVNVVAAAGQGTDPVPSPTSSATRGPAAQSTPGHGRTPSSRPSGSADPSATTAHGASPSSEASPSVDPLTGAQDVGGTGDGLATVDDADGVNPHQAAAEPLGAVQPIRDTGPIGLLALIATISIVGVTAGAIRAIVAQRAIRTRSA